MERFKKKKKNYDWSNIENSIINNHNFGDYARTIGFSKNSGRENTYEFSDHLYDKQRIEFLKDGKYLLECVYTYYKFDDQGSTPDYFYSSNQIKLIDINIEFDGGDYYYSHIPIPNLKLNIPKCIYNKEITDFQFNNQITYSNYRNVNGIPYGGTTPLFNRKYAQEEFYKKIGINSIVLEENRFKDNTHEKCTPRSNPDEHSEDCETRYVNTSFKYRLYAYVTFGFFKDDLFIYSDRYVASNGYYGGFNRTTDLNGNTIPLIDVMMIGVEVKRGKLSIIKLNDNGIKDITYDFKGYNFSKNNDVDISVKYNTTNSINRTLTFNEKRSSTISQSPIISNTSNSVDLIFLKQIDSYDGFARYNDWLLMIMLQCCVYKIE